MYIESTKFVFKSNQNIWNRTIAVFEGHSPILCSCMIVVRLLFRYVGKFLYLLMCLFLCLLVCVWLFVCVFVCPLQLPHLLISLERWKRFWCLCTTTSPFFSPSLPPSFSPPLSESFWSLSVSYAFTSFACLLHQCLPLTKYALSLKQRILVTVCVCAVCFFDCTYGCVWVLACAWVCVFMCACVSLGVHLCVSMQACVWASERERDGEKRRR